MTRLKNLDDKTLSKIQEMVKVTFAGRDRLYSAANHLDNHRNGVEFGERVLRYRKRPDSHNEDS